MCRGSRCDRGQFGPRIRLLPSAVGRIVRVLPFTRIALDMRMTDPIKKLGPIDGSRINVNEASDVEYWCKEFGCTEFYLRVAVNAVGSRADYVRAYLPDTLSAVESTDGRLPEE